MGSYVVTVLFLSFQTDRCGQTVQTQIRLLQCRPRSDCLIRVYTVCYSVYVFRTHFSIVKPRCSNFRIITANFLGVSKFLGILQYSDQNLQLHFVKVAILAYPTGISARLHDQWPEMSSYSPFSYTRGIRWLSYMMSGCFFDMISFWHNFLQNLLMSTS